MKIAVVGSINIDMVVQADRIPLKGETLMGKSLSYTPGGKGANQAVAVARLGGEVTMFGAVGDDDNGKKLLKILKEEGVSADFIETKDNVNTGIAIITVGESDNTIIVVSGANNLVDKNYIDKVKEELLTHDIVIMQNEIPMETIEYVAGICNQKNIITILNPAPAKNISKDLIGKMTYITPNEHEAAIIFGEDNIHKSLIENKEKLIITEGSKGVKIALSSGEIKTVEARKSNVCDTTGAGDTFNGAFAYAISNKMSITDSLRFANVAAGLSTEKFGAQGGMPTKEQVEQNL